MTSGRLAAILFSVALTLLFANLLVVYLKFVQGYEHLRGFIFAFYFDHEANFPSLYSALLMAFASALLWVIGSSGDEKLRKQSTHWKLLSFVFAFLAVDEFGSVHESLIQPVKQLLSQSSPVQSDYLYFAWLIPYSIATLIIGLVYLRFFRRLPVQTRLLFLLAAAIFLSGAVVMEMVGGKYWADQGWALDGTNEVDLRYALITTVEEFLEMSGSIIFVCTLLHYYLRNGSVHQYIVTLSDAGKVPHSDSSMVKTPE